jgi:hypothetical protein
MSSEVFQKLSEQKKQKEHKNMHRPVKEFIQQLTQKNYDKTPKVNSHIDERGL